MARYECVREDDTTNGGAACIATICRQYKRQPPADHSEVQTVNGIVERFAKLGFEARAIRITREGFAGKVKLPCIVRVLTNEGLNHFVVLHKILKKHFLVADPAQGLRKVEKETFFEDFNGYAVICAPTSTLDKIKEKMAFGCFFDL